MLTGGNIIDNRMKVLIVEDREADKQFLKSICREVGIPFENILECQDHAQVLGSLNRGDPDLVLLDLDLGQKMEIRQTVELLQRWRKETGNKIIPVIIVSDYIDQLTCAETEPSSAVVIRKPSSHSGERNMFSDFLKYAIRTVTSQRLGKLTMWSRIGQQFERVEWKIKIGILEIKVPRVIGIATLLICAWGAFKAFAKSAGWVISDFVWALLALLALAVLLIFGQEKTLKTRT
jgi:CheY-like chemotaxis protein